MPFSNASFMGVAQYPQLATHSASVHGSSTHLQSSLQFAFIVLAARRAGVIEAYSDLPYCTIRTCATGLALLAVYRIEPSSQGL